MILSPLNLSSQQSRGSSARWRKIPVQKNSEETGRRTVLELLKCCCKGVIENLQFYGTFIQTRQDFPLWRLLMQKYCSIVLYQLLTVILVATLHHTDCVFTSLFPIHCRSSLFHHSIGFIHVSISVSHVSKNKMLRFCHSYFPYLQSANTTGHLFSLSLFTTLQSYFPGLIFVLTVNPLCWRNDVPRTRIFYPKIHIFSVLK